MKDISSLRLERDMRISENSLLVASSWNSKAGAAFLVDGAMGDVLPMRTTSYGLDTGSQAFVLEPNLRADQLSLLTRRYRQDIRQHCRIVEIEMPGELQINARGRIRLTETVPGCDGTYDIESIERSYSPYAGFRQQVRARQSADGVTDPLPI
jgi:hypothetical protein